MINLKNNTQKIVLVGICTAIIIVLSQIAIPMPTKVPVTLQTFAISLVAFILGAKLGTISVATYVAIGALGIPVFSQFSSGFGYLFGFTGGFLFGFIVMAFVTGIGNRYKNKIISISLGVLGLLACHICGALQYAIVANIDVVSSLLLVSVPYLLKDVISVLLAYIIAQSILFSFKKAKIAI